MYTNKYFWYNLTGPEVQSFMAWGERTTQLGVSVSNKMTKADVCVLTYTHIVSGQSSLRSGSGNPNVGAGKAHVCVHTYIYADFVYTAKTKPEKSLSNFDKDNVTWMR